MKRLLIRLRVNMKNIFYFLLEPRYFAIALLLFYAFMSVLQWLFQLDLLIDVFRNPALDVADKIDFMLDAFKAIFTSGLDIVPVMFTIIATSMAISVTFMIIQSKHSSAKKRGSSSIIMGVFGSGCVACGGSVISPVVSLFVSGTSVAASNTIQTLGDIVLVIAAVLSVRALMSTAEEYARVVGTHEVPRK